MAERSLTDALPYPGKMTPERWEAGGRYLDAVRKLGFDPKTALWIFDEKELAFNLAFITDIVDRVGSLRMYDVLFGAYEKAVTPSDFDPWIVALFSPTTFFANEFAMMLAMNIKAEGIGGAIIEGQVALGIGDFTVRREWIYCLEKPAVRESRFAQREWTTFRENVERKAA